MKLDEGMDTGPVIIQKTCQIDPDETAATLHDKLSRQGAELVADNLYEYLQGTLEPITQDNTRATATKIINKADGRIDWHMPAADIERQLRAYTPWPGLYCYWNVNDNKIEQRVKIIKASVAPEKIKLSPGQTKQIGNCIIVGCGHGSLKLQTIQLEGKKQMPLPDFLKGYPGFSQTKLK